MKSSDFTDTISWYNQNALEYANATASKVDRADIDYFIDQLLPNASVLDAGCAAGRDTNIFYQRGLKATGIDASKVLISLAKKQYPPISFQVGDFTQLPFPPAIFDGIWCHASLIHMETRTQTKRALTQFFQTLKEGGIIYITVKAQLHHNKTERVADEHTAGYARFFRYYSATEIKQLLTNAGFIILKGPTVSASRRSNIQWLKVLAKKPSAHKPKP
jgi:SAM-dependent methyltransferase